MIEYITQLHTAKRRKIIMTGTELRWEEQNGGIWEEGALIFHFQSYLFTRFFSVRCQWSINITFELVSTNYLLIYDCTTFIIYGMKHDAYLIQCIVVKVFD